MSTSYTGAALIQCHIIHRSYRYTRVHSAVKNKHIMKSKSGQVSVPFKESSSVLSEVVVNRTNDHKALNTDFVVVNKEMLDLIPDFHAKN